MAIVRSLCALAPVLAASVLMTACVTEPEVSRVSMIKQADPSEKFQTLALQVIELDGKPVGTLETMYLIDGDSNDSNDRHQHMVRDQNGGTLGWVTDRGEAYRIRAHGGSELVANQDKLENNVLRVFGRREGKVSFSRVPTTIDNDS